MNEITFSPTVPIPTKRGRRVDPRWRNFRRGLLAPRIRDGQWYTANLEGLSVQYARKVANDEGFKTQIQNDALLIAYCEADPTPAA